MSNRLKKIKLSPISEITKKYINIQKKLDYIILNIESNFLK